MSVIIELSIFPTDKGDSVSPYVARAFQIIKDSGLPYALNPMGTCIEGDWEAVMTVVNACFEDLKKDCDRIYMAMKADYRKGRTDGIRQKVTAVETKMSST